MLADRLADHSPHEADWPMPNAEVRRLLEPVPHWAPAPVDDAEPETD